MLKEIVSLEPRKCQIRTYEDAPLAPDQIRAKVAFAAAKHGTEFTHFRGEDPFLENYFDETYQLFLPSEAAKEKPFFMRPGNMWVGRITEMGSEASGYYAERVKTLERTLEEKYEQTPQVMEYALPRLELDGHNFRYSYGIGSTYTYSNLGLCAFLVTLLAVILTAPVFSSDYMTGADDILRCARHGRSRLAAVKLAAALLVDLGVLLLSLGAFLAVVYAAFGFDDITSAELLEVAFNPQNLDAMGVLGWILLSSVLSFFAMNCFTLFLSAKFRNSLAVLALALAAALLPTILRMCMPGGSFGHGFAAVEGNFFNWLRVCLPSGGVSMTGAMLDELTMLHFLWIGNFVTWSPYILLAAAAIQIPVWLSLAVHVYRRHEAA